MTAPGNPCVSGAAEPPHVKGSSLRTEGLRPGLALSLLMAPVAALGGGFFDGVRGACAGLDTLIRFGNVEIPVARNDLTVPTVRLGIEQLEAAALSSSEIDVVGDAVPILFRAESQGLPLGPLTILETLFPGRLFARSTAALTFRVSSALPLDPASPPWGSITKAPELMLGVPAS